MCRAVDQEHNTDILARVEHWLSYFQPTKGYLFFKLGWL